MTLTLYCFALEHSRGCTTILGWTHCATFYTFSVILLLCSIVLYSTINLEGKIFGNFEHSHCLVGKIFGIATIYFPIPSIFIPLAVLSATESFNFEKFPTAGVLPFIFIKHRNFYHEGPRRSIGRSAFNG